MSNEDQIVRLRLYIAKHAPNSTRALANLRALLGQYPPEQYQLEVIDIFEDPQRALRDRVLITPTLVRLYPEPTMYVMGDLSETAKVLAVLAVDVWQS